MPKLNTLDGEVLKGPSKCEKYQPHAYLKFKEAIGCVKTKTEVSKI